MQRAQTIKQFLEKLWCETFHVDKLTYHDDFFDLGGNSLHALAIIASVNEEYSIEIDLVQLFENSNIDSLAKVIEHYLD